MVRREAIQKLGEAIAERFAVERVILFGSYAYGVPDGDSDVDLLVVMEYEGSGLRKSVEVLGAIGKEVRPFACDLIVMKPEIFKRRYVQLNPLVGDAVDKGKVLYERRAEDVDKAGGVGLERIPAASGRFDE